MSNKKGNTLGNGEWLLNGNSLWSSDGSVEFKMQGDGKIAVYHGGECRWQSSPQQRQDIKGVMMQDDGNLVMYDNNSKPVWSSDTAGHGSNMILAVQNDGNVVLYKGEPIWATSSNK